MNLQHTAPDDVVARLRRSDRRRLGRACAGLAVAVLVLALLRVVWGTYQVTVPDLVRILGGETIPGASFIVLEEKLLTEDQLNQLLELEAMTRPARRQPVPKLKDS